MARFTRRLDSGGAISRTGIRAPCRNRLRRVLGWLKSAATTTWVDGPGRLGAVRSGFGWGVEWFNTCLGRSSHDSAAATRESAGAS